MTDREMPETIWAGKNLTEYYIKGQKLSVTFHDGVWSAVSQPGWLEYIRADIAQAERHRAEKAEAERDSYRKTANEMAERAAQAEARAETAEANMARLATAGNVLALRLRHIVGQEDIIRRWENLHAALRQEGDDE